MLSHACLVMKDPNESTCIILNARHITNVLVQHHPKAVRLQSTYGRTVRNRVHKHKESRIKTYWTTRRSISELTFQVHEGGIGEGGLGEICCCCCGEIA